MPPSKKPDLAPQFQAVGDLNVWSAMSQTTGGLSKVSATILVVGTLYYPLRTFLPIDLTYSIYGTITLIMMKTTQ